MVIRSSKNSVPWFPAVLAAVLLAFALIPVEWILSAPQVCVFHAITGRDCPGCGLTRAASYLLHGDWRHAFELNWRITVVLPLMLLIAAADLKKRFHLNIKG